MEIKKKYKQPTVIVVETMPYSLMDSLSMGVSDQPATGGGDAKDYFFDEEEEEVNY